MDRKEGVALESDSLFLKTNCQNFQQLFMHSQTDHVYDQTDPVLYLKTVSSDFNRVKIILKPVIRTFPEHFSPFDY